jgi:glycosyltransferase involved in cell wall biosynthesis
MASVSAVLPAYNEEENLPRTTRAAVDALTRLTSDFEVIIVDDGSRDATAAVASKLAEEMPRVRLVAHGVNQGYGQALATGFASATKDLVFFTDSDGQFVLDELERLLAEIDNADLVIGYRAPRRDPFVRWLNAQGWNTLINALFGYTAKDVDCAFKLFRRSILDAVTVQSRGATFSAEFLVRARANGFRVVEVPVTHLPRVAGQATGAKPKVILRAFKELIAFRRAFRAPARPS